MFAGSDFSEAKIRKMIFLDSARRIRPELHDALIENSLLQYLTELYGRLRMTGEFDELRTIAFEDLFAATDTNQKIAHQVAADYQLLESPFLGLAAHNLDSIVNIMGGLSREQIRAEKATAQVPR